MAPYMNFLLVSTSSLEVAFVEEHMALMIITNCHNIKSAIAIDIT
jgi:hypothetical protein